MYDTTLDHGWMIYPPEQFSEREITIFTYVSKSFSSAFGFFVEDVFFSDFSTNQWIQPQEIHHESLSPEGSGHSTDAAVQMAAENVVDELGLETQFFNEISAFWRVNNYPLVN